MPRTEHSQTEAWVRNAVTKNWVFTLNNPVSVQPTDNPQLWVDVRFLAYQSEQTETGQLHYQGYVIFESNKRLSGVKAVNARCHWEPRRGTHDQALKYATKDESRVEGPWVVGEPPHPGKRNDLDEVKKAIDEGLSELELSSKYFQSWCRHSAAFAKYRRMHAAPRSQPPVVYVYYGPTGTGKSRKAAELAETMPAYWQNGTQWWDDYCGQPLVVLDEFTGAEVVSYQLLLRLLDRYPITVNQKGTSWTFEATHVVITSNLHPRQWYPTISAPHFDALMRRINYLAKLPSLGIEEVEKTTLEQ